MEGKEKRIKINTEDSTEKKFQFWQKLAQEGKEVLCEKGFTKEQQEILRNVSCGEMFVSTADTTTKLLEMEKRMYLHSDIEAMWLRDSSAQVVHYLPSAKEFCRSDI